MYSHGPVASTFNEKARLSQNSFCVLPSLLLHSAQRYSTELASRKSADSNGGGDGLEDNEEEARSGVMASRTSKVRESRRSAWGCAPCC
mmetsp:Transcript_16488/g.33056  ORF Transcript_16488/g.33056 Transcript_16488/m.33056 type:complete len:89 (-) Transcript_16488:55-321(-)